MVTTRRLMTCAVCLDSYRPEVSMERRMENGRWHYYNICGDCYSTGDYTLQGRRRKNRPGPGRHETPLPEQPAVAPIPLERADLFGVGPNGLQHGKVQRTENGWITELMPGRGMT